MRTIIQTKDIKIPGFVSRWLERALAKVLRHHQRITRVTAHISKEGKHLFRVQFLARVKGRMHVVEVRQQQLFWAVSEAVDRLQRELRRSKERTSDLIKKRKRELRGTNFASIDTT